MKRALIVAGNGTTDQEFVYPYYRLQEAGWWVDVGTQDGSDVAGVAGIKIAATRAFPRPSDLDGGEALHYDMLVLAGGVKAIEKLRQDRDLIAFIAAYHLAGGVIASICHGGQLLISAGLVRGRRISAYYSIRDDITNAGGTYVDEPAVVCDRIVSSAHYKHLGPWMAAALAEVLENRFRPRELATEPQVLEQHFTG